MNKLAILAFTLLVIFGNALWYLADNSINAHVKTSLITLGEAASQQTITIASVDINRTTGYGIIHDIEIYHQAKNNIKPILSIPEVNFRYIAHNDKNKPIIIENITIINATVTKHDSLQLLLANIQKQQAKQIPQKKKKNSLSYQLKKITLSLENQTSIAVIEPNTKPTEMGYSQVALSKLILSKVITTLKNHSPE